MKTLLSFLKFCIIIPFSSFAQVGVYTSNPLATLDVNGNMMLRSTPQATTNYNILAIKKSNSEVSYVDPSIFTSSTNTTVGKATATSGTTLLALDLSLFNTDWNILKLPNLEINPDNFTSTANDFYYTVPSTGKYYINFRLKNTTLLSLGLATDAQMGILATNPAGTSTLIDSIFMNAISTSLLSGYYFENMSSIYILQAGDKIRFLYNKGSLSISLGLLANSSASLTLFKISN